MIATRPAAAELCDEDLKLKNTLSLLYYDYNC